MATQFMFQQTLNLNQRQEMYNTVTKGRSQLVAMVVCEPNKSLIKEFGDKAYLVNSMITTKIDDKVAQVMQVIRNRLQFAPSKNDSLILYAGSAMATQETRISELMSRFQDREDGILYLRYARLETTG